MARIFFTVFMVDNNILDILLIKCEPWYVSKHDRHLCSKITHVKSNNSNVSVNKFTAYNQHSATFLDTVCKESTGFTVLQEKLLFWHRGEQDDFYFFHLFHSAWG